MQCARLRCSGSAPQGHSRSASSRPCSNDNRAVPGWTSQKNTSGKNLSASGEGLWVAQWSTPNRFEHAVEPNPKTESSVIMLD
jgi:hypothetical protein